MTALGRLRNSFYSDGPVASGPVEAFVSLLLPEEVNHDLNTPKALAVVWDLGRSDLDSAIKKATLISFDRVPGL